MSAQLTWVKNDWLYHRRRKKGGGKGGQATQQFESGGGGATYPMRNRKKSQMYQVEGYNDNNKCNLNLI